MKSPTKTTAFHTLARTTFLLTNIHRAYNIDLDKTLLVRDIWRKMRNIRVYHCRPKSIPRQRTIRHNILKYWSSTICRVCQEQNETVDHGVSICDLLSTKYLNMSDSAGQYISWLNFKNLYLPHGKIWWEHNHLQCLKMITSHTSGTSSFKLIEM